MYANIKYEVDEVWHDLQFCELTKVNGVSATFVHNKCIIGILGVIVRKKGKTCAVSHIHLLCILTFMTNSLYARIGYCLEQEYTLKTAPDRMQTQSLSIHKMDRYASLFKWSVPVLFLGLSWMITIAKNENGLAGWLLKRYCHYSCSVGRNLSSPSKMLQQFLHTKGRSWVP